MFTGFELGRSFLVLLAAASLSCGGGEEARLSIEPASATAYTDYTNGFYQAVPLTAVLSNGQIPMGVQWKTTHGCVAINPDLHGETNTAVCNFTCPIGTLTADITATAQGKTGKSRITCTWR